MMLPKTGLGFVIAQELCDDQAHVHVQHVRPCDLCQELGERLALRLVKRNVFLDVPDDDCTDAAHPAWWRGEQAGAAGAVQVIDEIIEDWPASKDKFRNVHFQAPLQGLVDKVMLILEYHE